jgi:hypothetical protein
LKGFTAVIGFFDTGHKVADDYKENMTIKFDQFLSEWNYVAIPSAKAISGIISS